MFRFARAAGFAAAAIMLAGGAAYADPTLAFQSDSIPVSAPYTDHIVASLDAGPLTAEILEATPASPQAVEISVPVATHAAAILADQPTEAKPLSLHELVSNHASKDPAGEEQECLAGAVYFESKGEPLQGQLAVAEVVLNRSRSGLYPRSICGVVKQKSQFSFVRGGRIPAIPRASDAWRKAVAIAHIAERDLAASKVSKAMFFHATHVRPGWRGRTRLASVGNHIFYR